MPIIEFNTPGEPDGTAAAIARHLTASPEEYVTAISRNRDFCKFMWTCFFHMIEDIGFVPQPTVGQSAKKIVCFVPFGTEVDPALTHDQVETLSRGLRSVRWDAEVVQKGKKLFYRLEGVLSASDTPTPTHRCILPTPIQFSHLMRPENEGLTRLIWMFGDNILRSKKTFSLGSNPAFFVSQAVLSQAVQVYQQRGWNVHPWQKVVGRQKTHYLDFTLPVQRTLPAPGNAQGNIQGNASGSASGSASGNATGNATGDAQ